jgi:hypothetical protein
LQIVAAEYAPSVATAAACRVAFGDRGAGGDVIALLVLIPGLPGAGCHSATTASVALGLLNEIRHTWDRVAGVSHDVGHRELRLMVDAAVVRRGVDLHGCSDVEPLKDARKEMRRTVDIHGQVGQGDANVHAYVVGLAHRLFVLALELA